MTEPVWSLKVFATFQLYIINRYIILGVRKGLLQPFCMLADAETDADDKYFRIHI